MIVEQIEQGPGSDILEAVRKLGAGIDTVEGITRLRAPGRRHASFRLKLTDGRTVKGRRFKSAERRESVTALYPLLEGLPLSRILSVHGAATIEEWIHGSPVEPGELGTELIHDLASILGTLHSRSVSRGISPTQTRGMDWHSGRLRNQLTQLVDLDQIGSETARKLFDRAMDSQATGLENGIIHTDFHPRNMVMKQDGEIWIIDNEGIRLGALDYDVARCWRQWPMTRAQRDIFCKAYRDFRSLDSFLAHQEFWSICTLVHSARIHLRHRQPSHCFLERLEQLSLRAGDALWPELS